MTREQIRQQLQAENPASVIDGVACGPGDAAYEALLDQWTDAMMATPSRKVWPNAHAFWESFTPTEQLAILGSQVPEIRLLDRALVLWQGEVWSDDARVQHGIDALVAAGILTPERRATIIG